MKTFTTAALLVAALSLGACVSGTKKDLSREMAAHCAQYGDDVRIRVKEPELRGGIFGSVVGSAECLQPEDEGYASAMTIEEYLESLETRK